MPARIAPSATPSWRRCAGRRPIVVVILSKHAFASRWVKRETDWAEELKERDPSRALLPVTVGQIERDDFGTDNGWLAYYRYKRVEAPDFAPFPPDQAARRLLHALGLTSAGEAPVPAARSRPRMPTTC
jgi:hypothetical protein